MRWQGRAYVLCLASLVLVLPSSDAAAAKLAPITGKLSKPGYTLIALADSGKARSVRVTHARFKLRPPAKLVTLQLRAKDGVYAGPIVVGVAKKGKRAIVGVKAGTKLGKVKIKARKGYAKLTRKLPAKSVVLGRWARARNGVPIGAANFGRVRSKLPRVSPPGDLDADGVPDRLDIDINGNLIINNVDHSTRIRAQTAQAESPQAESPFWIGTSLFGGWFGDVVNANARAVTDADIDRSLARNEYVAIGLLPGSPELDCGGAPDPNNPQGWIGGLSYCTRGGTGEEALAPGQFEPFPACCDPDGNGYGTLTNNSHMPPPGSFSLKPNATSSQIGTGDVLIQRVTSNGVTTDTPTMLPFVFATAPALVAYDDGQGDAATISYPVDPMTGPGRQGNGFPVAAGPNGDVTVTLTFWRPQRRSIPPEPGAWTDIGKLSYWANIESVGASNVPGGNIDCPKSAYSVNDPNLTLSQDGNPGVTDLATDQPANPAHTVTYTLNVTNCLAAVGVAWNPGEEALIHFFAADGFTGGSSTTDTGFAVFTRR